MISRGMPPKIGEKKIIDTSEGLPKVIITGEALPKIDPELVAEALGAEEIGPIQENQGKQIKKTLQTQEQIIYKKRQKS